MSEAPQAPDWWRGSDGKWYPPPQASSAALPPRTRIAQAKLRTEVQAVLEPGEQLQALFMSQTGPSPRGATSWGLGSNLVRYWAVAVTDRNIVICPVGRKGSPARLPREPIEIAEAPSRRWWFPVVIGGRRHWVAREQYGDVAAVNESLRAQQRAPVSGDAAEPTAGTSDQPSAAASPAWYPDPTRRHQVRYWDGRIWTAYVADQGAQSTDPIKTS